ncbi:fatty acid elongase [Kickxella alabastrina]|uniref:Uncharacterized protein n=1 Tax=Kickxella alabastrina TaxID=61397 RepID=A0ACC1IU36_9FUNG|nr:fatty acid elongase [Kickxella alabastrina]KAI7828394.1 fatty acid elongase [Kickxella alabastrina]KAJ1900902.1 hypothetical protein LPJ66_001150 [Kickxella alabastrina]KAJ1932104.1 hypothetical protein GGF37_007172 [Kickxella alabastrina]
MPLRIDPPAGTHVNLSDIPLGEWYPFFMQWQVPTTVAILYTVMAFYFNPKSNKLSNTEAKRLNLKVAGTSAKKAIFTPMNMFVFAHNAILAVYSAWAFMGVFPTFINDISTKGLRNGLCDFDGTRWNSVLFMHTYLFYLSKFYELIDSVIIILKGRKASVLQIYHHAGVIMVMYFANYYCSSASVFIVWENAGVHTIMYTYYALTVIGISPPGKQYLTSLQIFQFLFGQSVAVMYMLIPGCETASQRTWVWILTAYLLPLIYLFVQFFVSTYKKPVAPKQKKAE